MGDYRQAIDLLTEALAVDRDTGYRHGDPCVLDPLGRAWLASGDPGRAREAAEASTRLRTTISAAGVAADTGRLLDVIASHDRIGILAEARADREW